MLSCIQGKIFEAVNTDVCVQNTVHRSHCSQLHCSHTVHRHVHMPPDRRDRVTAAHKVACKARGSQSRSQLTVPLIAVTTHASLTPLRLPPCLLLRCQEITLYWPPGTCTRQCLGRIRPRGPMHMYTGSAHMRHAIVSEHLPALLVINVVHLARPDRAP